MIYELTLASVKLKLGKFNPPARLINNKELCCAVGIAYKQAGLGLPAAQPGENIDVVRQRCLKECGAMDESVQYVIEHYTAQPDEVVTEDALVTLKLGYNA